MGRKPTIERAVLVLIAAVALAGFIVSPALGGPGFLTKKKADKLYLKKRDAKKQFLAISDADARFITRADAGDRFISRPDAEARFASKGDAYSRAESDSRFLRPEGEIRISSGPNGWQLAPAVFGPDPQVSRFVDSVRLRSNTEATVSVQQMPDLPTALYGRATRIAGAELCYSASANARISLVILAVIGESEKLGSPTLTEVSEDETQRTDDACRTYPVNPPVALGPGDFVSLSVLADYPNNVQADLLLGRATFILQP